MEAAGRGGIPREEVANNQFGVPVQLRRKPPICSTIMKTAATGGVQPDNPRWGGRSCRTRRTLDSDEGGVCLLATAACNDIAPCSLALWSGPLVTASVACPGVFRTTVMHPRYVVGQPHCKVLSEGFFSETAFKIALPSFYFTAVTVRQGTISVDGVQNFPAYFRYEFFSETGAVLASYASDPDAPFCDEVSSKEARDP
jgi:hypothetical protein